MPIELQIPEVGESITEVEIGEWLKKEGDFCRRDENVVVIETEKVTVEVVAPEDGTLTSILKQRGEAARVGDVVGMLEPGADPAGSDEAESTSADAAPEAPVADAEEAPASDAKASDVEASDAEASDAKDSDAKASDAPAPTAPEAADESGATEGEAHVMPAAARALAQRGLEASEVRATGPGGRLLKEDVEAHVAEAPASRAAAAPVASPPEPGDAEEVVPMSPMRRAIASRLVEAQQTAALLTTFNEIDMSAVMALRKDHQDDFVDQYGTKVGFMSFFVKATVDALKRVPVVNAEVRERSIVYKNHYDIGVAVGGGKGLVVPVIRAADQLSFAEIELTISDLAKRAQSNKLGLAELSGGTFTISNGGVYGSLLSTPILNPPQSGILGLHSIQDRPVAIDGEVVIRPMMYVALTYDHRIVDGREAVTFLKRVKEAIEAPARMLLEV